MNYNGTYKLNKITSGFSLIFPIFEHFREDKSVNEIDLPLSQITDFVYINPSEIGTDTYAKSKILRREVYKKEAKEKLIARKLIYWKTNKKASKKYSSYVFSDADFSSDRKEPLNREISISNSQEQIKQIFETSLIENIKKGWERVENQPIIFNLEK